MVFFTLILDLFGSAINLCLSLVFVVAIGVILPGFILLCLCIWVFGYAYVLIELIKSSQFIKMTVKPIVLSVIIVADLVKQLSNIKNAKKAKDDDHEEE